MLCLLRRVIIKGESNGTHCLYHDYFADFLSHTSFTFEEIFNLLNEFIPEETAFASMTKHPSGGVILIGGMVIYY
jgi:hypothetical protein